MKRVFLCILSLVLVLGLFAGCSGDQNPTGTTAPSESTAPTEGEKYDTITIEKALELCGSEGNVTTERYYIRGTVVSVTNAQYGAMVIKDETGSISVYGTYSADGSIGYAAMDDKPYKGDEVLLYCILQNYNGTKEVKNAQLISFTHADVDVDESKYTQMTIADARKAEDDTLIKTTGVVARVTYADGMKPNGFLLVDNTQSIYVYDADAAQRVQNGNTVTILASRTTWVLDTEKDNATKYGYKGCTQLDRVTLLENDGKTDTKFDTSWVTESTVKEIMDNPVSNDITSTIFKVNALVTRQDGKGFINYYINDLDGKTGSYTYTQCSGSDFAWLDAFDGKICTVYLVPLNCKSTASGCAYRFLPVAVEDNGFKFDLNDTAEHIVKYYGVGQFQTAYTGNPALELVQSVSSELLGFKDAKLTYKSSDSSVISIDGNVMNCHKNGTAVITVTGTYDGKTYSQDVTIQVEFAQQIDAGTVKDAIDAKVGDKVTIKGIIAASLVNKDGFYIIDDTGIIAVLTDADTLATLQQGQEIIIEGVRDFDGKKEDSTWATTCVKNAKVLVNNYGKHEYSTKNFITGKTLADFAALDVNEDHTTEVYVVKAKVNYVETNFYTLYTLISGDVSVNLYCANGKQYSFLKPYVDQEITLELVPCNWSSKSSYPGCVLSVITDSGKVYNTLNFKTNG